MSTARSNGEAETRSFSIAGYFGEISSELSALDIEAAIHALVTPATSSETLHWGRNYLYSASLATPTGDREVVVKQFRNQGFKGRWERRWKGSKAARSWCGAWALRRAAIPTPAPLLLIESDRADGPSFYVAERLPNFLEARYYFRALEAGDERERYPQLDADRLIASMGAAIRRLHDAGIWHRDLSIGNLLLVGIEEPATEPEIYFVDLNRSRVGKRLGTWRRTRDLCRLRIFRRQHQQRFLSAYWGSDTSGLWSKRLLYRIFFEGFLAKIWLKEVLRKPFRGLRERVAPRHPHVHIPQAPEKASVRDRVVWDGLSDQPHQHATRLERLAIRLADAPLHARELAAGVRALPAVRRRYRELREGLYREPVPWSGMGIALRPRPDDQQSLLNRLEELGVRKVLLRLHPWQEQHDAEEELATELSRHGYELAFSMPQSRELVRDPEWWRASVTELVERFGKLGRHFQVGQAINRSKWGVWNYSEYLELFRDAAEILRRDSENEVLGPAVIDYEPLRTAAMVNLASEGVYFDALASLLYVDRRGAPENRQLGFDTVDKVLQLKAIADTSDHCGDRSWITETNWPLWEGPHSPAGRKVAVDEETQASYLVRYYLLALTTGAVERVYWWQLVARGYGLCHEGPEGDLIRRPSFAACAALARNLSGATFVGPLPSDPGVRLFRFRFADSNEVVVGWTTDEAVHAVDLPRPVDRACDRDGSERLGVEVRLEVEPAPRYFWLRAE